jgi:hypothetical protein
MHIIIDGYNLIGISHRDMQSQRERLVEQLIEYRKKKEHDITLVFDGWKGGQGRETRTVTGGITVIYSGLGERADDVIRKIVSRRERKWIVVSSDREVENAAWKYSCVPVKSDDFYDALVRSVKEVSERSDNEELWDDEEEEYYQPPKGNPRKLSKKQKEIKRVLQRL